MFKAICQKYFTKLQGMKNTHSNIKPMKTEKKLETTYCLGCKDYTHSFRPQEVTTKYLEKST